MAETHYTEMNRFVRRSSLTFPINVPRFVEKAHMRGADCCIMDLEDSVPLNEKEYARKLIKESIPTVGKGGSDVAVRINNSIDMAEKDLQASIWPGLTCVSLPKVESAAEVRIRDEIITKLERERGLQHGSVQISVVVETALGVLKAFEIAKASPRIVTLSVGAEDLTREMGVHTTKEGQELLYARSKIIMDAYAAGIQPLGIIGVEPFSWGEPEKFYDAAIYSRNLGFKGCGTIHPAPIPYINAGFSIPEEDIVYMKRALTAFEEGVKKGVASVNLDGRMIDIATAERCKKVLERAKAIETMENKKERAMKDPSTYEKRLKSAIEKTEKMMA